MTASATRIWQTDKTTWRGNVPKRHWPCWLLTQPTRSHAGMRFATAPSKNSNKSPPAIERIPAGWRLRVRGTDVKLYMGRVSQSQIVVTSAVKRTKTRAEALRRGRELVKNQAWGAAFAEFSAADREASLESQDLFSFALSAHLLGREDDN